MPPQTAGSQEIHILMLLSHFCGDASEMREYSVQALTEAKANDLLFWASRYHLFVHWSANRAHPWDSLPKSEAACAILEIGKLRNSDGEVRPASTATAYITACMHMRFSCMAC